MSETTCNCFADVETPGYDGHLLSCPMAHRPNSATPAVPERDGEETGMSWEDRKALAGALACAKDSELRAGYEDVQANLLHAPSDYPHRQHIRDTLQAYSDEMAQRWRMSSARPEGEDARRLDWLGKHAMRSSVGECEAEIRVEYAEGEGFRVREWGKVVNDDEGHPDWRNRLYRSTLYPTLREAIDAAMASTPTRSERDGEEMKP